MNYTFKDSCLFVVLLSPYNMWNRSKYRFLLTLPFNVILFPIVILISLFIDFFLLVVVCDGDLP